MRRPKGERRFACAALTYLSAAICSLTGICSTVPESPEARAIPAAAFSRIASVRSVVCEPLEVVAIRRVRGWHLPPTATAFRLPPRVHRGRRVATFEVRGPSDLQRVRAVSAPRQPKLELQPAEIRDRGESIQGVQTAGERETDPLHPEARRARSIVPPAERCSDQFARVFPGGSASAPGMASSPIDLRIASSRFESAF